MKGSLNVIAARGKSFVIATAAETTEKNRHYLTMTTGTVSSQMWP